MRAGLFQVLTRLRSRPAVAVVLAAAVVLAGAISCAGADFDPVSKVNSVRILASKADKPYAHPGDSVNLEVLAFDGRAQKTEPMKVYWLPFLCVNPPQDAYYRCFAQLGARDAGAVDAGAAAGIGTLKPGVDLTSLLTVGAKLQITLPPDIVSSHEPSPGQPAYGIAIAFNIACAGHVEIVASDPTNRNPQQVPLGCFDSKHNALGPADYVIGFTRVYAYDPPTPGNPAIENANPVIDQVTFLDSPVTIPDAGAAPDPSAGITTSVCTASKSADCTKQKIDVTVPDSSWELNPSDVDQDGTVRHEELWADYYVTMGELEFDARLLFDPRAGAINGHEDNYQAPTVAGDGTLWVVVHDSRGGADWKEIPLHVR